jgi:hypothetical protein
MSKEVIWSRRVSDVVVAIGGATAGSGVYGAVLYDLSLEWAAVAVLLGLALIGVGVLAGGRLK